MKFEQQFTLQTRGPFDPGPDEQVEGILLVGEYIAHFEDNHNPYGCDYVRVHPAFLNGQRCWLRQDVWSPAWGYCASGTQERVLDFEDGLKTLIERGCFDELFSVTTP